MKSTLVKITVSAFVAFATLNVAGTSGLAASAVAVSTQPQLPRLGDSNADVTRLQQAIVARGFTLRGGITGTFNPSTRTALRNLQKVAGFKPTGRLDAHTAKFLGLVNLNLEATKKPSAKKATVSAAANNVLLRAGDRNDMVRLVQQAVMRDGIGLPGGADGIYGNATRAAVAEFQKRRGLPITGIVNQVTMDAVAAMSPVVQTSPVSAPVATVAAGLTIDNLPKRGQTSENVRSLQNALINAGIVVKGGADGVFGVATTNAVSGFQTQRGLSASGVVDAETASALGLIPSLEQLGLPKMQAFPMQGRCSFVDSWHEPRSGGRLHEGTDVIGARGLAIYAVMDGVITRTFSGLALGGNAIRLTVADGTYFYYSHLDGFAPGIASGVSVRAGQVIGYNGSTGNAGSPHLHFEIHPRGGAAINPFPLLKAIDGCSNTAVLPQ